MEPETVKTMCKYDIIEIEGLFYLVGTDHTYILDTKEAAEKLRHVLTEHV